MIKIIYCVDKNNGFSKNNSVPWNVPSEMKHFKKTTNNKIIVMGRKTYESIGHILPNRKNIIFSRNENLKIKNAIVTSSIDFIIDKSLSNDVYIIGGIDIINIFLSYADEIIESVLYKSYPSDLFLNIEKKIFKLTKTIKNKEFKINYYKSKILSGYVLSKKIKNEIIIENKSLIKKYNETPKLVIIQMGENLASNIYVANKLKMAKEIGVKATLKKFNKNSNTNEICSYIKKLNKNILVHGILVQLPLEKNVNVDKILNTIDPLKDVDCLTEKNIGKLFNINQNSIIPCTPKGILEILQKNNIKIESKNITIIGRSNIVGKPLSILLLNQNATITICHSKTNNLKSITKNSDIIISAVGIKKIVKKNMIKKGSIIIDVGINRDKDNTICGDVDFDNVISTCSFITPVPKGVGPMTVIMLFKNLLIAFLNQK